VGGRKTILQFAWISAVMIVAGYSVFGCDASKLFNQRLITLIHWENLKMACCLFSSSRPAPHDRWQQQQPAAGLQTLPSRPSPRHGYPEIARPVPGYMPASRRTHAATSATNGNHYNYNYNYNSYRPAPVMTVPLLPVQVHIPEIVASPPMPMPSCNPNSLFKDILNPELGPEREFDNHGYQSHNPFFKRVFKPDVARSDVVNKLTPHSEDIVCELEINSLLVANEFGYDQYKMANWLVDYCNACSSSSDLINKVFDVLSNTTNQPGNIKDNENLKDILNPAYEEEIKNKKNIYFMKFFKPGTRFSEAASHIAPNIDAILSKMIEKELIVPYVIKKEDKKEKAKQLLAYLRVMKYDNYFMKKTFEIMKGLSN
jgi:hypothetical protein